jgi:hypothetical protein
MSAMPLEKKDTSSSKQPVAALIQRAESELPKRLHSASWLHKSQSGVRRHRKTKGSFPGSKGASQVGRKEGLKR